MTLMMSRKKQSLSTLCPIPVLKKGETSLCETVSQNTKRPSSLATNPVVVGEISRNFASQTLAYHNQLNSYLDNSTEIRKILSRQASQHAEKAYSQHPTPSASLLRDKSSWTAVKNQVVREELMKLQISGKTDLPLTPAEVQKIQGMIQNKDLTLDLDTVNKLTDTNSSHHDPEVAEIMAKIVRSRAERSPDYLSALAQYKETGETSPLLQQEKLAELSKELKDVDLSQVTQKQFKKLVNNYCETTEFHHKNSISNDHTQQNNPDNIAPLKKTDHENCHRNQEGKLDYRDPVKGDVLDRQRDLKIANRKRVFRNELKGVGMAVAVGVGLGFSMSFIAEAAIQGISGENLGTLLSHSTEAGLEAGVISAVTYGAGRLTTELIQTLGVDIATKSGVMLNMAAVGAISLLVVSGISYARMRWHGTERREALAVVGKQMAVSGSILILSLIAQSAFGGLAGMLVSLSIGLIFLANGIMTARHENEVNLRLQEYTVAQYRPLFSV